MMSQLVAERTALVNFELIKPSVDPAPFLAEIDRLENPWDIATGRQDKIKVQREARVIAIRGLRKSAIGSRERRDVHESRYTSTARLFPYTTAFLESFALEYGGELARAKIVCLPAGHRVYPHIDRGEYYAQRDRFHLILQGQEGSWLKAGEEQLEMRTGELWRFDNKAVHEAYNGGSGDRIHFIFDLKPLPLRDDKNLIGAE
ncbi:aspartyl/asparaginyl beta-hydroxylase domain-containing protein [Sphingobium sp. HBC34]|uniref:Aspartyl/asparaginyl beta-hydroxylase domain-containing protein n=1 Tax=Sphingobium cyanobacteriorum TaxID=3063954 RepID=A0ABT8ZTU3_9SPHN|nr:aspartyl/asparaginyl beta-hydroxylase domain-containing protein [Sphingobium sp. HBC34]MDO7837160.1 aspartyl/asparaginyl beta-hydroxylase domain-containing protein [Sphingobium sp. HBC34]